MLLKEIYNQDFLLKLSEAILQFDEHFNKNKFLKILESWQEKALKQRMRSITLALNESISLTEYSKKIEVLKSAVQKIKKDKNSSLALIIFPDFVEVFGLKNFEESMRALEFFTEFGSSEFAVRQFIKIDQKRALEFFAKWSNHKNYHIRRLSSEGCRPRLPWGEALNNFKKNPSDILPILENLKNDKSEYVRRSVANNLNDISKDHPEVVLSFLKKWQSEGEKCINKQRLTKHALRTLLKKGDNAALKLIGIERNILLENFAIQSFSLQKDIIKTPQSLIFDFALHSNDSNKKVRLEYAIFFLKKNGSYSKKIFQITTKNFAEGVFSFSKKHSFCDLSTRKHYAGKHYISLVANGVEFPKLQFDLITK